LNTAANAISCGLAFQAQIATSRLAKFAAKIRAVGEARVTIDYQVPCDDRPYSVPHSQVDELIRPGAKD
jgi:hypothetical protein